MNSRHGTVAVLGIATAVVLLWALRPDHAPAAQPRDPGAAVPGTDSPTELDREPNASPVPRVAVTATRAAGAEPRQSVAVLRVRLRHRSTGEPVRGGTLLLGSGTGEDWSATGGDIDARGRFVGEFDIGDCFDWISWDARADDGRWHGFRSGKRTFPGGLIVTAEPGAETEILVDAGAVACAGVVRSAASGAAVADARIRFGAQIGFGQAHETVTDAQGAFRFDSLDDAFPPDQDLQLWVDHGAFLNRRLVVRRAVTELVIRPEIALQAGLMVSGRIEAAAGDAVAGCNLELVVREAAGGGIVAAAATRSQADGSFGFDAIPRGALVEIDTRSHRFPPRRVTVEPGERQEVVVTVRLDAGTAVAVTGVSADGGRIGPGGLTAFLIDDQGDVLQPTSFDRDAALFTVRNGLGFRAVCLASSPTGSSGTQLPGAARHQLLRGEQLAVARGEPLRLAVPLTPAVQSLAFPDGVRTVGHGRSHGAARYLLFVESPTGVPLTGPLTIRRTGSMSTTGLTDGRLGLLIVPGRHRLQLESPGCRMQWIELSGREGTMQEVRVQLQAQAR